MKIEKRRGERMQPCLTPFSIGNHSVGPCFVLTAVVCLEYADRIKLRIFCPTPISASLKKSPSCQTESYAF